MNLTPHFTLEELIFSQTALDKGIDNEPNDEVKENLLTLASGLERVRNLLGNPMLVSSGYRSAELNAVVHGVSDSAHLEGFAADFTCPDFGTPQQIVNFIHNNRVPLDQCIVEGAKNANNGWVHLSFDPKMRNEYMNAVFENGIAHYSKL